MCRINIEADEGNFDDFEGFYKAMMTEFTQTDFGEPFDFDEGGVVSRFAKVNRYGVVVGYTYRCMHVDCAPNDLKPMSDLLARMAYVHFEKNPIKLEADSEEALSTCWFALKQRNLNVKAINDYQKKFFARLQQQYEREKARLFGGLFSEKKPEMEPSPTSLMTFSNF